MNSNNNDNINTSVENSFTNENNSQMSEKQLSFITLPYKGQQGEKVVKSFKTMLLNGSLPNNIETKVLYTGTKLGSNFEIKTKQSSTINMIQSIMLNVRNVKKTTLEKQVGDLMNGFVTIVGRIANLTC